ncbi:MAG: Autotransporter [Myxococcaceae bacterium]|nr:Autotransporter [Myxococcaceae bacterium]
MAMPPARTIALVACAGVLFWSAMSRADTGVEARRFDLVYDAPAGCPDRSAFLAAVRARTPRSQLAEGDERSGVVMFRVTIEAAGEASTGQLEVREPDGSEQKRTVSSRTCGEVAKALALVAALILDPDAQTGAEPAAVPPSPPSPPAPPLPPAPPATAAPVSRPPPDLRDGASAHPHGARWQLSAGAAFGLTGGIGPSVAPLAGVLVDLALDRPSVLAPSFRLTPSGAVTIDHRAVGSVTYTWLGATARACPLWFPLPATSNAVRIAPCVGLEVGVHEGAPHGVPNPTAHSDLWIAPVALGSVAWAATSRFTVELEGGVLVPLRRTHFFLAPGTTLYDVPAVAGTVLLSGRVRFL